MEDLFAQRRRYLSTWYDCKLKQIDNVVERITHPDKAAGEQRKPFATSDRSEQVIEVDGSYSSMAALMK